jgi:hypothetical protein
VFASKSEIKLFRTSSQLSTALGRCEIKVGSHFSLVAGEEKKGKNKHNRKQIYGCLKWFHLSINIFLLQEKLYSQCTIENCGENRIVEANLEEEKFQSSELYSLNFLVNMLKALRAILRDYAALVERTFFENFALFYLRKVSRIITHIILVKQKKFKE